jgi:CheY-like chemotaxis protein
MAKRGVERAWCPTCQADVEVVAVSMGTEGIERPRCSNCGSFLDEEKPAGQEFSLAEDQQAPVFSADSVAIPVFKTVLIVGYRDDVRGLILEQMTLKNMAREIVPCVNGEEMIIQTINVLQRGEDGEVSLVVLDVPMPFLNGINAAIGLRAVERTYSGHRLVPLLFLTRKPCDETFKKVIKFLAPAKYAGLGPSDNPAELGPRLGRIISLISQEKW